MVTHDAVAASYADRAIVFADGQIVADEANPTAETMNDLLMAERERATRAAVTSTRADTLARLAGVKDVPNLPITDAPCPSWENRHHASCPRRRTARSLRRKARDRTPPCFPSL